MVNVQIWVRWTLPRLRIDQVMTTCLKYLIPISCALFLGGVLWPLMNVSLLGRTTLFQWPAAWSEPPARRVAMALDGPAQWDAMPESWRDASQDALSADASREVRLP